MKEHITGSRKILLICIFAAFCILPVWAESVTISREITPSPVSPGDTVQVRISIDGMSTGGIVETIPAGCTFLSTTCPSEKYRVSGNTILFSVIDDREITYLAQAREEGTWTFAGIWDDTLNETDGTIPDSRLTVGSGVSAEATIASGATQPSTTPAGPGMTMQVCVLALALVVAGAYHRSRT
ncbi:MAG: hypothetical protein PWP08_637 [Methanofollis sp.]|nr:hypothetical protein [Methanofollis sp.]